MEMDVRAERPEDIPAIRRVNEEAFGQPLEARLVEQLRANGGITLSLVAVVDDRIVGHLLFSPVKVSSGHDEVMGVGLGPVAVLPEYQRQGIGTKLINEGIGGMREAGSPFIVVLGHAEYYPRFGFVPASRYGVRCQWEVPDDVFMLLPLDSALLPGVAGMAVYRDEFAEV